MIPAANEYDNYQFEVLFLTSHVDGDSPDYRKGVQEHLGSQSRVHYHNGHELGGSTPTIDQLMEYDCVMVHSWGAWGQYPDPALLGDTLADFVDQNGTVVMSTYSTGIHSLKGRILKEGYSPVDGSVRWEHERDQHHEHVYYKGDGHSSSLWKGIHKGFHPTHYRDTEIRTLGDGVADGSFTDDVLATAYRPDYRVVYLNGASCDGGKLNPFNCPGGMHLKRWANACMAAGPNPNRRLRSDDYGYTMVGVIGMSLVAVALVVSFFQRRKKASYKVVNQDEYTVTEAGLRVFGEYVELSPIEDAPNA